MRPSVLSLWVATGLCSPGISDTKSKKDPLHLYRTLVDEFTHFHSGARSIDDIELSEQSAQKNAKKERTGTAGNSKECDFFNILQRNIVETKSTGQRMRRLFRYNCILNKKIISELSLAIQRSRVANGTIKDDFCKSTDEIVEKIFTSMLPEYLESFSNTETVVKNVQSPFKNTQYMHRILHKLTKNDQSLLSFRSLCQLLEWQYLRAVGTPIQGVKNHFKEFLRELSDLEEKSKEVVNVDRTKNWSSLNENFSNHVSFSIRKLRDCVSNIYQSIPETSKKDRYFISLYCSLVEDKLDIIKSGHLCHDKNLNLGTVNTLCDVLSAYSSKLLMFSFFNLAIPSEYYKFLEENKLESDGTVQILLQEIRKDTRIPEKYRVYKIDDNELIDFINHRYTMNLTPQALSNPGYWRMGLDYGKKKLRNLVNYTGKLPYLGMVTDYAKPYLVESSGEEQGKIMLEQEREYVKLFLEKREDDFSTDNEYATVNDELYTKRFYSALQDYLSFKNYLKDQPVTSKRIAAHDSKEASIYYDLRKLVRDAFGVPEETFDTGLKVTAGTIEETFLDRFQDRINSKAWKIQSNIQITANVINRLCKKFNCDPHNIHDLIEKLVSTAKAIGSKKDQSASSYSTKDVLTVLTWTAVISATLCIVLGAYAMASKGKSKSEGVDEISTEEREPKGALI